MEEHPTLTVSDNAPYAPLIVRLLRAGTQEHQRLAPSADRDVLEFFDARSADTVFGVRICSYVVDEVLGGAGGLNLNLGVPEWALSASARMRVGEWVDGIRS